MQAYQMLIDGEWVGAVSGETFDVRDPSSDEVIATAPAAAAATLVRPSSRNRRV